MKYIYLLSMTFVVLFSTYLTARSPEFSSEAQQVKKGIYQHYRGQLYEVAAICHHSETLEELVVYRMLYEDFGYWVRPMHMFLETVITADNQEVPRFKYLGEAGQVF